MMMLTVGEILSLHDKLIAATGGMPGLRDMGLLESAIYSPNASFGDDEQYPTIQEKAARLAYSLTMNHAFNDGNKRIGMYAMLVTLDLNGIRLTYTQRELIELGLGVADGFVGYEAIFVWIKEHNASLK